MKKKIIEVEKLQEILNLMGNLPVGMAYEIVTKFIQLINISPEYLEAEEAKEPTKIDNSSL